jgi:hypothetical protein
MRKPKSTFVRRTIVPGAVAALVFWPARPAETDVLAADALAGPPNVSTNLGALVGTNRQEAIRIIIEAVEKQGQKMGPAERKRLEDLFDKSELFPGWGAAWADIPAPSLLDTDGMKAVRQFVGTNGWNMCGGILQFYPLTDKMKPLKGLPWPELAEREYQAITHEGILYVVLRGGGLWWNGVAWDPQTNGFPGSIRQRKPLGHDWYVWTQEGVTPKFKK